MNSKNMKIFIKKLPLFFFIFSIFETQAMEHHGDPEKSLHELATRMNSPTYQFLQTNLKLEYQYCVLANDGQGCFSEPCYRLIFEDGDGQGGATHILPSIHDFPYAWLPLGFRKAIFSSRFFVSETGPEETHEDAPSPPKGKNIFGPSLSNKILLPTPLGFSWFDQISIEAQNTLLRDIDFVRMMYPDVRIDSRDSRFFDQFHPFFIFVCCFNKERNKKYTMEGIAEGHCATHLALEPDDLSDKTLLHYFDLPIDLWVKVLTIEVNRLNAPYSYTPVEDDEADYAREDLNSRNEYWIEHTLSNAFQPGELGLLMFGATHAKGPHGILTFLKRTLAQTNWAKNKRSPAQKIFWKGLHLLKLEELKGRAWKEVDCSL